MSCPALATGGSVLFQRSQTILKLHAMAMTSEGISGLNTTRTCHYHNAVRIKNRDARSRIAAGYMPSAHVLQVQ